MKPTKGSVPFLYDLIQFGALTLPREEPASIIADISRLTTQVEATPEIGLETGLLDAAAWWRDRT